MEYAGDSLFLLACDPTSRFLYEKAIASFFKNTDNETRDGRILAAMAVNWIELAQKMAQAARAGVAIERKRLQEILAERQRKKDPAQSSSHLR
jgi:hypothetical protein